MATENDIVLVYLEDSPVFFARVEAIWPDVKKDWFNIELLVLQVPVKMIVWTLKDIYINGTEFFMGGKKMRIEVVEAPRDQFGVDNDPESDISGKSSTDPFSDHNPFSKNLEERGGDVETPPGNKEIGQLISLADFQKKKKDNQ